MALLSLAFSFFLSFSLCFGSPPPPPSETPPLPTSLEEGCRRSLLREYGLLNRRTGSIAKVFIYFITDSLFFPSGAGRLPSPTPPPPLRRRVGYSWASFWVLSRDFYKNVSSSSSGWLCDPSSVRNSPPWGPSIPSRRLGGGPKVFILLFSYIGSYTSQPFNT